MILYWMLNEIKEFVLFVGYDNDIVVFFCDPLLYSNS